MKFQLINILVIFTLLTSSVESCGPGRGGGRRRMLRKYHPLVERQYLPNMSENTLGASGRPEGRIKRTDKRFKDLVQNWNQDIEFRDDERTGADRMMSQRLKEKLSTLAISVMNQWPNVKLRVTEGWDEDDRHPVNSLHYEGRAVDITTSDRDTAKYGMLARLAVEAGFDWVHYETRYHVHCSVKSEKADTIRNNGCFDASSVVVTPDGEMEMSQLQTNDMVLTMNPQNGQLGFSPIILWLDRDELGEELYVEVRTKSNRIIRLTSSHLIYVSDEPLDLTQQQSTSNTGSGDNNQNNNNNYYYYETQSSGSDASDNPAELTTDGGESNNNNNSTTKVPSTNNLNQLPNDSNPSLLTKLPPTLSVDDVAFTTYARNAIVGQYLLVSAIGEKELQSADFMDYKTLQPNSKINQNSAQLFGGRPAEGENAVEDELVAAQNEEEATKESADDYFIEEKGKPNVRLVFKETNGNNAADDYDGDDYDDANNNNNSSINSNDGLQDGVQRVSNSALQITSGHSTVLFDQIVSVNYVTRKGIYAPLTREGNIVVNSVVASCYALINDHELAHMSFAPVRWFSYLNEWLTGLRPQTPLSQRTLEAINRKKSFNQLDNQDTQKIHIINSNPTTTTINLKFGNNLNTIDYYEKMPSSRREIHWYARMLYSISRFILPTRYMY